MSNLDTNTVLETTFALAYARRWTNWNANVNMFPTQNATKWGRNAQYALLVSTINSAWQNNITRWKCMAWVCVGWHRRITVPRRPHFMLGVHDNIQKPRNSERRNTCDFGLVLRRDNGNCCIFRNGPCKNMFAKPHFQCRPHYQHTLSRCR